jgi:hypothetical protein
MQITAVWWHLTYTCVTLTSTVVGGSMHGVSLTAVHVSLLRYGCTLCWHLAVLLMSGADQQYDSWLCVASGSLHIHIS